MPAKHLSKNNMFLSPAKLNLGLKIVGKRSDGYHLLKTIFCLIDFYDQINIEIIPNNPAISLVKHHNLWQIETDLAYRAAKLLQDFTKIKTGARIQIKKNIFVGGGMGGGSSNAATVLLALNYLWQTNLSTNELINLGKTLGADVTFFIYGKNALATEIGDEVTPISLPQQYFVLINPGFSTSTKEIFTNLKIDFKKVDSNAITVDYLLATKDNDLENVVANLYPRFNAIIKDLALYGNPRMTGSGSTIYLNYTDIESAKKVAYLLKNSYNPLLVKSLEAASILSQITT